MCIYTHTIYYLYINNLKMIIKIFKILFVRFQLVRVCIFLRETNRIIILSLISITALVLHSQNLLYQVGLHFTLKSPALHLPLVQLFLPHLFSSVPSIVQFSATDPNHQFPLLS